MDQHYLSFRGELLFFLVFTHKRIAYHIQISFRELHHIDVTILFYTLFVYLFYYIVFFLDKFFWSQGFKMTEDRTAVPLFLGHIANEIFTCGKAINLLKLTNIHVIRKIFCLLSITFFLINKYP